MRRRPPTLRSVLASALALIAVGVAVWAASAGGESPYVVTAIDNHFHDAHPTLLLDPERTFIVKNQGRNLHNVTLPEVGFSRDLQPGQQVAIERIGNLLGPGRHQLVCNYHVDLGMRGIVIVG